MRYALVLLALLVSSISPVFAQDAATTASTLTSPPPPTLSEGEKAAIQELVKNYLTKDHPEVIMQAMQELQKRDQASAEAKTSDAIKTKKDKIYNDPNTPVGGNPKGDVTIVEFSDFQCGYCKMSEPFVERILKEDKNVRFVYKDFPVLGPVSTTAAKVALAAFKQGNDKYIKLHDDLLSKKEHLNDDMIYQAAKDAGVDVDRVKKEAASDEIQKQVQDNLDLGTEIGVRGTPMFIIGEKVYPGALQYEQMKKAIEEARASAKKG